MLGACAVLETLKKFFIKNIFLEKNGRDGNLCIQCNFTLNSVYQFSE